MGKCQTTFGQIAFLRIIKKTGSKIFDSSGFGMYLVNISSMSAAAPLHGEGLGVRPKLLIFIQSK
ncbi:hypothetical protein HYN59_03620 [Flavobacterium album]|uniref:Uncharacterized protein n=1 Tax=Flavobacterium album TaxID=2175091 RepID=A0A2S1QV54_9FLAO|nr:hypothetical protein HYN59_03620 [Flavobacterium album]